MTIHFGVCKFTITSLPFAVYIALMAILLSLGNWQLSRSKQKQVFLAEQAQKSKMEPLRIGSELPSDIKAIRYRRVEMTGYYDIDRQFLLDNQIRHGKAGYFVMTPLQLDHSGTSVLINRGWVEVSSDRKILPDVSLQNKAVTIRGRINTFPEVGIHLAGAETPSEGWPALVQVIDSKILSDKLGYPLADYQIELDPSASDGYLREWRIATAIPPEKHIAYAMQWFGLALTLTALFIWYGCKKSHERSTKEKP